MVEFGPPQVFCPPRAPPTQCIGLGEGGAPRLHSPLLCRSRLWRRIWSTFTAISETFWAMAWIRSMRPTPGESLVERSQR